MLILRARWGYGTETSSLLEDLPKQQWNKINTRNQKMMIWKFLRTFSHRT
jgi:hypothetical protein